MRPNPYRHFSADSIPLAESQGNIQGLPAKITEIAQKISRLHKTVADEGNAIDHIEAKVLRQMLEARRTRTQFFSSDLFADPAWDMLLELLVAELTGQRVTISSLCTASNVPTTTALRWIKTLEQHGLVKRRADPLDARRYFIALTNHAELALKQYFSAIDLNLVI